MDPIKQLVDWFLELIAGLWDWLMEQIVIPEPPAWVADTAAAIGTVMTTAGQLGYWFPFEFAVGCALTVIGCYVAALVVQVVRIVASFMSAGGGGT